MEKTHKLNYLYCWPDIVWVIKLRRMRWMEHVAYKGERRGVYRVLLGNPERKKALGRSRHSWKGNIKLYLQELGRGGINWTEVAQDKDG
jgi:hypothetical protein